MVALLLYFHILAVCLNSENLSFLFKEYLYISVSFSHSVYSELLLVQLTLAKKVTQPYWVVTTNLQWTFTVVWQFLVHFPILHFPTLQVTLSYFLLCPLTFPLPSLSSAHDLDF